MKKLSVPAMFSENYLINLQKLNAESNTDNKITEVYGSMPGAPIGTIRPSNTLPSISKDELLSYIRMANKYGFEYNYIMNSTVLDGSEYIQSERKEVIKYVGDLVEAGLNNITITVPFIIKLIRKHFPNLKITASICAEIDSAQRAIDFAELGANCIVMAKDVNRNFNLLEQIRKSYTGDIKLLCTTPCIYKCSDLFYHMNLSSTRDNNLQESLKIKGKFISHTAIRCQRRRLERLEEYIKSPWIRPEDLQYYDKIGVNSFKIDGRDKTEEYNLEVIRAYMGETYKGNLLYLMQHYYPKDHIEMERVSKGEEDFWRLGVYLDNTLLDGFINSFYNKKVNCDNGCNNCNYCSNWAKRVISIDEKNTNEYLLRLKREDEERLSI